MIARLRTRLAKSEDGFTLIELLVSSLLFGLVMAAIAGVMYSTMVTQKTVTTINAGTNEAQLVATSIESRIRNSSEFRVTAHGADQMLVARVAGTGSTVTWKCYAWYYSAANGGSIRVHTSTPGVPVAAPTAPELASWTILLKGVTPRSGTTIFTATTTQLSVAFNATVDGQDPVAIDFATAKLSGVSEASTCY
jgi:prepilin-type N-terminal cleavage/methylation domain-containing protein